MFPSCTQSVVASIELKFADISLWGMGFILHDLNFLGSTMEF